MKEFTFSLNISYSEWLQYYRGYIKEILVNTDQGQQLNILADRFFKFTSSAGLYGRFKLLLLPNNKFYSLEMI